MKEADRIARINERLLELFPTFRVRLKKVIANLEAQGVRPRIQDAWRSPEDQRKAHDAGNSELLFGFHNVTAANGKPESLAVDLLDDDAPLSPSRKYLFQLAAAAEKAGLTSGIRFGLPPNLRQAVNAAIAAQDWNAKLKIGWDPTHVEPVGMTVEDARAGRRPA